MRILFFILFLFHLSQVLSQTKLTGLVLDEESQAMFAVNIFLKNHAEIGVITDLDGKFSLEIPNEFLSDTLVSSYIGFQEKEILLAQFNFNNELLINLKRQSNEISQIDIIGNKKISDAYAIQTVTSLDIYLNPLSQGDPLKFISTLAASTNTDESANPKLRGSNADRSRIILNGIPVYKPVRNSQINGIGNFSLFNTAIVAKQDVYVSNPPLTYGNTSAGLVEIQTYKEIDESNFQISASLANFGYFVNEKFNEKIFIQWYGNFQFHQAFKALNKTAFEEINSFGSFDNGLNLHYRINKKTQFNLFNYAIKESFDVNIYNYNQELNSNAGNKRNFSIMNWETTLKKGILYINQGLDFAESNYNLGITTNQTKQRTLHTSVHYQLSFKEKHQLKIGGDIENQYFILKGKEASFFYATEENNPSQAYQLSLKNNFAEVFGFYDLKLKKLSFSLGARLGQAITLNKTYLSYQSSIRYQASQEHSVLFSSGHYNNFSIPYAFNNSIYKQSSYQLALDYTFKKKKMQTDAAVYFKNEQSDIDNFDRFYPYQKSRLVGLELQQEFTIKRYFTFLANYTYSLPKIYYNNQWITSNDKLNYFARIALSYSNPNIVNISINYQLRNGLQYFQFQESTWNPELAIYQPNFNTLKTARLKNYNNISLNISRYIPLKYNSIVVFASANNLLNFKNQRNAYYNEDYSRISFNYLQLRSFYFGIVVAFK